ncbi:response regulator [Cupriavidus sp. AU9028]|uniref:ATP-binding response regulator n=1 Tax=Cupriavidus sp. AU9028 TaxID=2871157 RepID=UPI001C94943A|nr:response regulator [Cupriavidus sp. AU9028]MBY4896161.1 response regulator [Cupriavidus sp. AU9028]
MTAASILIVEDDRVVARDIAQQLTREGYRIVATVGSGEEALRIAEEQAPDLVLMDLQIDGARDGIEVAAAMRDRMRIPVVFLTAYADRETVQRATLTEPFGYLVKPFEDSQLRTVVQMALYKYAAEQRLRQSESRFAATLASIGDAVIATDSTGHVTFINPAAEAITGWPGDRAMGLPLSAIFRAVHAESREPMDNPAAMVLRTEADSAVAGRATLLSRDGPEYPIDYRASAIIDGKAGVTGVVVVVRDLTQQLAIESALQDAQAEIERVSRIMTMGELTASIAHEIIQPITAVVTHARAGLNFLARQPVDIEEVQTALTHIVNDGRRAADVVRSVRSLADKSRPEVTRFDLNDVIREVLSLTTMDLQRNGVRLTLDLSASPCIICGDLVQMRQVLLNLIKNGVEAMYATPRELRNLRLSSKVLEDGYVRVCVRDSGCGFGAEALERAFEPFFTTKEDGMGMGLSICRTIMEAHSGRLGAVSHAEGGAIVSFELPTAG